MFTPMTQNTVNRSMKIMKSYAHNGSRNGIKIKYIINYHHNLGQHSQSKNDKNDPRVVTFDFVIA